MQTFRSQQLQVGHFECLYYDLEDINSCNFIYIFNITCIRHEKTLYMYLLDSYAEHATINKRI